MTESQKEIATADLLRRANTLNNKHMIKTTVNQSQFMDSFSDTYKNTFTYQGKIALFEYLEELSEGMGEDIELDTVALCCEYSEYEDFKDFQDSYYGRDEKNPSITSIEELLDHTQVIEFDGGIIIQDF